MFKQRNRKAPLAAILGSLVLLALPAAAQAHHVVPEATAICAYEGDALTATVKVDFSGFNSGDKPVNGTIKLDEDEYGVGPITWDGNDHTYTWTQAVTPGTYTVSGSFTWGTQGGNNGAFTAPEIVCEGRPTPPTEPPTTTTTTPTTPLVTPTVAVLPETVASGIARLRGPSGCVKQAFRAKVSGRSIAAVAFYVDGKMVKNIKSERSMYRMKVRPSRYGFGRHQVKARVTFTTGSGTQARVLPLTFRRCAQDAVAPQFTG